jgi:hypothetical protein
LFWLARAQRTNLSGMGFNKPTWTPGHERRPVSARRTGELRRLRARREHHDREKFAARELEGSLLSLAALLGSPVKDPDGHSIGDLRDVIVNWTAKVTYPPMTAIVVRTGKRDVMIGARWLEMSAPASVRLSSTHAYAHSVKRSSGDIALGHDVLDQQVVDSAGTQVVRPADVYLATVRDRVELIGIEVGLHALLRRLGPKRLRARIRPERVIDWGSIEGFAPRPGESARSRGRRVGVAGQPGTGIELGGTAAEIKPVGPSEVRSTLKRTEPPRDGDPA